MLCVAWYLCFVVRVGFVVCFRCVVFVLAFGSCMFDECLCVIVLFVVCVVMVVSVFVSSVSLCCRFGPFS